MEIIIPQDHLDHDEVLGEALNLYIERDTIRGDLWRQFPPSDKIRELRERVMRITGAYERMENESAEDELLFFADAIVSDALDMINYSVFLIRQLREGARG